MDFTIQTYNRLLNAFQVQGYKFQTYMDYSKYPDSRVLILRHDVDKRNSNSLEFARIQHDLGIKGTYYFRIVPESFDRDIISEIESMGHEIGYHYEDMDLSGGDPVKAIELFEKHLAQIREVAKVSTICMHGSPLSRYDNRDIWSHYDYKDFGIIAEPYFDLDYSKILYLTDTGRRWDGDRMIIRDTVGDSTINKYYNEQEKLLSDKYQFRTTQDIIQACLNNELPDQMMINFHPQRWTDNPLMWTTELVMQSLKNVAKLSIKSFRQEK